MKGTCQKIETLGDGSAKLSIYVNKEQLGEAVSFSFQEVEVELASAYKDRSRQEALTHLCEQADRITDAVISLHAYVKLELEHEKEGETISEPNS